MLVARLFSKIFKDDGIILVDYTGQKYICGNPKSNKPITVKLLKKNQLLDLAFLYVDQLILHIH